MTARTYYEILEVEPTATAEEIKQNYRFYSSALHPDKHSGSNKIRAEEKMKALNEAYQVLRDPQQRAAYDRTLFDQHYAQETQQKAREEQRRREEERQREKQRQAEEERRRRETEEGQRREGERAAEEQRKQEEKRWRENQKRVEPQGPSLLRAALVAISIAAILVVIYAVVIYWLYFR